ncbi:MAG: hypothetical protein QOK10_2045, partial [Pseudonocardiales bacterium]|nr:hypothetical protein [Pseudonocardiales bacterium]
MKLPAAVTAPLTLGGRITVDPPVVLA